MTTHELAAKLRELSVRMGSAPAIEIDWSYVAVDFGDNAEAFKAFARVLGSFDKRPDGDWRFEIRQGESPFHIDAMVRREAICTKRVVTKEIEEWVCAPLLDEKAVSA